MKKKDIYSTNPFFKYVLTNNVDSLRKHIDAESKKFSSKNELRKQINEIDQKLRTPIFYAIALDNYELVEILLAHEAQINILDFLGRTPFHHVAIIQGKNMGKITELLITYLGVNSDKVSED